MAMFSRKMVLSFDVNQSASATRGLCPLRRLSATEELGRAWVVVEQVLGRRGVGVVPHIELARLGAFLALDAGKEADEAVEIVLRPTIERMVVTLVSTEYECR